MTDASFDALEIDYYANVLAVDREGHRIHKLRDDLLPLDTIMEMAMDTTEAPQAGEEEDLPPPDEMVPHLEELWR